MPSTPLAGIPRPLSGSQGCALCGHLAPLLAGNAHPHVVAVLPDALEALPTLELLSAAQAVRVRDEAEPARHASNHDTASFTCSFMIVLLG